MKKKICIALFAIIATLGFCINLDTDLLLGESINGNSMSYIIIFVAFAFLIDKAFKNKNKRLTIISLIISLIFSLFEIIGNSIVAYGNLSGVILNGTVMLKNLIKFGFYLIAFYSGVKLLFEYLEKCKIKNKLKEFKFFTANKKSIFIVAGIIFLFWLPYFLKYFPGIIEFDAHVQLQQAVGEIPFLPGGLVFPILPIKFIINITNPIFHNLTYSVGICVFIKMILMALSMSYSIYYMAKKKISTKIRLIITLFFAINPIFPLYAVNLDKDSIFAVLYLIDFILLFELVTNTNEFIKSKFKIAMSFIFILLTALIRPNGMYVYILLIPFLYIVIRKKYIKLSAFVISTVVSINLINSILSSIYNVQPGKSFSLYCVPMQAMARLVTYNGDNLTEEEKYQINLFVEYNQLPGSYNPTLSDPEMGHFRAEYMEKHTLDYLRLNIRLFFKYPNYYIESIMCNTSGYWFPENHKTIFNKGVIKNDLGIEEKSLMPNNKILNYIDGFTEKRNIPVIGMLFSTGITLWLLITIAAYMIYHKKYKLLITLLPLIYNYLIVLVGPSNTEFRYILPMYLPMAVIYCLNINFINVEREKKNENTINSTSL